MKRYRFEIVRRKSDRFGWRVLAIDDDYQHVLAYSERSYRRRRKARAAINRLRNAEIVDTTRRDDGDGLPLATTKFELVPGVVPLIVPEHPVVYEFATRREAGARDDDDHVSRQQQVVQAQQSAVQEPAAEGEVGPTGAEEDADAQKGKGRMGRRTKKTE